MTLSKRASWFLVAVGVWTWVIWPNFLRNIWKDDRSWDSGPTAFFTVHLVLTVVSLVVGTIVGLLGVRTVRAGRRTGTGAGSAPSADLVGSRR